MTTSLPWPVDQWARAWARSRSRATASSSPCRPTRAPASWPASRPVRREAAWCHRRPAPARSSTTFLPLPTARAWPAQATVTSDFSGQPEGSSPCRRRRDPWACTPAPPSSRPPPCCSHSKWNNTKWPLQHQRPLIVGTLGTQSCVVSTWQVTDGLRCTKTSD